MKRYHHTQGFSLLEIMVAVLILAIGLLGIAGLQGIAKRTNYEAMQRTTATMLAQEMVERIRANPDELAAYTSKGETVIETTFNAPSPNCHGTTANCTPAQLVDYDLYEWQQAIAGATEVRTDDGFAGGLVNPTGCIETGADPDTVTIAIAWRGMTAMSDPTLHDCGADTPARYSDPGETDNAYRRVMILSTLVTP